MTARKSAEHHAATGTTRRDRQRPPPAETTAIGQPPAHLQADLAAVWRELSAALPPKVGSAHDRHAFELLARLVGKSRTGTVSAAEVAHMRGLFESFGMTPTGRQRLDVKPAGPPARKSAASAFFRD